MKIMLWAILIGSLIMGYFGYKTGSATNAAIGIGVFILGGFTLFFLLKVFLHLGFVAVKFLLFVVLIAIILISGFKGCQYLNEKGRETNQQQVEEIQSFETKVAGQSMVERIGAFFTLSKKGTQQPIQAKQQHSSGLHSVPKIPKLPPKLTGIVNTVRAGYLIKVDDHFVKLYGIDAPDPQQDCLSQRGENFSCGHTSKMMLERLILGKQVNCQIVGGDYNDNYIATCRVGAVDIGASMVMAGWAVADRTASKVYIPYEESAHKKRSGLWAGKFVAPWQARAMRVKQAHAASQNKTGFWESLFK